MSTATATAPALPANRPVADWLVRELEAYVGGLSKPSKMPCHSYSLPAAECSTGGRLQQVEGSTCHDCYALKGMYRFPVVLDAMYRRLESITKPQWTEAMAELIIRKTKPDVPYFRWHDSGDLQSGEHFANIIRVCELTPNIQHWIPTREYRIVADHLRSGGSIAANLSVRMSAHMIGGKVPTFKGQPVTVSTVSRDEPPAGAHRCPAPKQEGKCQSCRACWSRTVPLVDYHLH